MNTLVPVTDINAPELDVFARRTEVQLLNREHLEEGLFIAESPLVIQRALDAGYIPTAFLVEDKHLSSQAKPVLDRCPEVPVYTAPFDVLTQLTGFALTRGMLCAMKRPPLPSPEILCRNARRIAVLEDVVNPTNVGAIIRSAAALGMDALLLTPNCSDPLYRRAIRVSMGTVFQIPWTYLPEGRKDYPLYLKELGFATAAMALTDNSVSIRHKALQEQPRLAVILGTEGQGLRQSTIDICDYTVKIPMAPGVDSLNVAAASAVAFWQLSEI